MCWRLPNSDEEANRIIKQMNEKRYGKFAEEAPDGEDFEKDVKTGYILTYPVFYYDDEIGQYDEFYVDKKQKWHIMFISFQYKSWRFDVKCYSKQCLRDVWNRAEEIIGQEAFNPFFFCNLSRVSEYVPLEQLDVFNEKRITIMVKDEFE